MPRNTAIFLPLSNPYQATSIKRTWGVYGDFGSALRAILWALKTSIQHQPGSQYTPPSLTVVCLASTIATARDDGDRDINGANIGTADVLETPGGAGRLARSDIDYSAWGRLLGFGNNPSPSEGQIISYIGFSMTAEIVVELFVQASPARSPTMCASFSNSVVKTVGACCQRRLIREAHRSISIWIARVSLPSL